MSQHPNGQNPEKRWMYILFFTLTPVAALILGAFYIYHWGFSFSLFALMFGYAFFTHLSITGGYHRLFSHRSYEAKPWVRLFFVLFGAGNVQGSILDWGTEHRRHHRFTDTQRDPYNINAGFFFAHMGWLFYNVGPASDGKYEKDLLKDPLIAWQHKYYFIIAIIMAFLVPMAIGWTFGRPMGGLIFGGLVRLVLCHHSTFFINSLCHYVGRQPYGDSHSARDSSLVALLTNGEGYHNFHHQFQNDYRNGIRWFDWDPTKWAIKGLSFVGATTQLRTAPSSQIIAARMQMDQKHLLQKGVSPERLAVLKAHVEQAQQKWRDLRDEYNKLKTSVQLQSKQHLLKLKAELRVAKLEFKMAWRQWGAYRNTLLSLSS